MYCEFFSLLGGYLYGADAVLTGDQTLVLTMISTIGALFVIVFPFIVVWRCLKVFL